MASSSNTPQATSASAWKGKINLEGIALELPSGNVALVKPMSIAALMSNGMLADSLSMIAGDHVSKGQGKPPKDFKKKAKSGNPAKGKENVTDEEAREVLKDPSKMIAMFETIDKILPTVVIEPVVHYHRQTVEENGLELVQDIPIDERDEDALYTDQVDFEDKLFIFNFMVGGTRDLESFRAESGIAVGSV